MTTYFQRSPALYALPHSVPPTLQQATTDGAAASTGHSWTLTGKSGSVSCGVTAPFSWVLVCTRFCLCPPRVFSPVLCKFWRLYGGVNGDLLQEDLCPENSNCLIKVAFLRKVETTIRLNPGGIMGFGTSGITRGLWFFSLTYITISL